MCLPQVGLIRFQWRPQQSHTHGTCGWRYPTPYQCLVLSLASASSSQIIRMLPHNYVSTPFSRALAIGWLILACRARASSAGEDCRASVRPGDRLPGRAQGPPEQHHGQLRPIHGDARQVCVRWSSVCRGKNCCVGVGRYFSMYGQYHKDDRWLDRALQATSRF